MAKYPWYDYFTIPWIAAFVGYGTNVLAIEMTFYPFEYWGIPIFRIPGEPWGFFGWQGIIPTRAHKMASISFDLMTTKLFNIHEIFHRIDPIEFSRVMEDAMLLMLDAILQEVASAHMPKLWSTLPQAVKDDLVVTAHQEAGGFIADFLRDVQDHIDDVIDVKDMTVAACVANKPLVVKIFQECGEKEFGFIRRSGFYFGFLFGIVQMVVWFFYDAPWTLPFCGFLVGWLTNWLALKLIFTPLRPINICGYKLQGIFLKRQVEVAATYARVIITEILHVEAIWHAILNGPLSKNFDAMLRAHTLAFTDKLVAELQPIAVVAMGYDQFAEMKEDLAQKVVERLPTIIDRSYEYTQTALDMENTLRTKMEALSPEDFEGVLHPAFEEDEIELIALGGALGLAVGFLQIFTVFN